MTKRRSKIIALKCAIQLVEHNIAVYQDRIWEDNVLSEKERVKLWKLSNQLAALEAKEKG